MTCLPAEASTTMLYLRRLQEKMPHVHALSADTKGRPPGCPGRNMLAKDGFPKLEGVSTLFEMFESSVRRFNDCDCLGWRPQEGDSFGPYKWWTYREVHGAQSRRKGARAPHLATLHAQEWPCPEAKSVCMQGQVEG